MAPIIQSRLNYKRAIAVFIPAYVLVTILAVALSVLISMIRHTPVTAEPLQNQAYLLSERFLPLMNLLVWATFAWLYFRSSRQADRFNLRTSALALGIFWVGAAVIVDYVGFVLIKNPISLSSHDFYIGQFPWIYLIYAAILFAPLFYVRLARPLDRKTAN